MSLSEKGFRDPLQYRDGFDAGFRAGVERAQAENDALRKVIEWALGEHDTFPDWPASVTITGNPKFWWRKELRQRMDRALTAAPAHSAR